MGFRCACLRRATGGSQYHATQSPRQSVERARVGEMLHDPLRRLVELAAESGYWADRRRMTVFDPKRTFGQATSGPLFPPARLSSECDQQGGVRLPRTPDTFVPSEIAPQLPIGLPSGSMAEMQGSGGRGIRGKVKPRIEHGRRSAMAIPLRSPKTALCIMKSERDLR